MSCSRNQIVKCAESHIGRNEKDGSHAPIIRRYNLFRPLPRGYSVKMTDSWCATYTSVIAMECEATDIIPVECSCSFLIKRAQEMGIWIEADNYTPQIADYVLYDWQDNGKGDNKGTPDHVGIIIKVDGENIRVIEGNFDNAVKCRNLKINGKYIRGYICPKYIEERNVDEIAREVLQGKWGNGNERKERLTKAGFDYKEIQKEVNRLSKQSKLKSNEEIAREVIKGLWGNGKHRITKLRQAGYDADVIQKLVNTMLK